jgi:hypothetical protein
MIYLLPPFRIPVTSTRVDPSVGRFSNIAYTECAEKFRKPLKGNVVFGFFRCPPREYGS